MDIRSLSKKSKAILSQSDNLDSLEEAQRSLLGKSGKITSKLKELGSLPPEERKSAGKELNILKNSLQEIYQARKLELRRIEADKKLQEDSIDVSLPGRQRKKGSIHPVTQTIAEISSFFTSKGFSVASGPEAESDYYNFEALNIPADHPAKDMHDTFYLDNGDLLRTHTSPVQVRVMEENEPPLRIICPGRVYRKDSDLTHTPMFHQIEGLLIEEDASFSQLKGLLEDFISDFFGSDTDIRFRPSYFPFTEPSAEVDIKWKKGWLEILGCGMVHPNVLEMAGIDSKKFTGFAFGLGPERIAMLKHDIPDLRAFFENDIRFIKQF